jgi:hypothetical protein
MADYHTALDLVLVDTTEEQTYVVTGLTLVEDLAEHLDASNDRLLVSTKTENLNLVAYLHAAGLDTTCGNSTTARD